MNNINRYALVVGVADYEVLPSLSKPIRDAEAVAQRLEKNGYFQVERLPKRWNEEKKCYEISQERLTGKELGQALVNFLQHQAKGHEALIYFSGHGITVTDELGQKAGFLAASDCVIIMQGKQIFGQQYGVSLNSLNNLIAGADFAGLVVILDCCHAAYFLDGSSVKETLPVFSYKQNAHLVAACRSFANVEEGRRGWGYSAFTTILLEALQPHNAGSDGTVRVDELYSLIIEKYTAQKVEKKSEKKSKKSVKKLLLESQKPIYMGLGKSLALVTYAPKQPIFPIVETCPYQGLNPFPEENSHLFFGRERVIKNIKQKLEVSNFLVIIGAAGSGKTSLLQAGLMPIFRDNNWHILPLIKPGNQPFHNLKNLFSYYFDNHESEHEINLLEEPTDINKVMQSLPVSEKYILIIDNFEEIFSLVKNELEKQKFIQVISQLIRLNDQRFVTILSLQIDFLKDCLNEPSLAEIFQDRSVYLSSFNEEELQKSLIYSVQKQGYELENKLGEIISHDFRETHRSLPLLQFTLQQLWLLRNQENCQLTREAYQNLGGLKNSLNQYAEQIYNQFFDPEAQKICQKIFLNLLNFDSDLKIIPVGKTVEKISQDLGESSKNYQQIQLVVDALIDAQLLITTQLNTNQVIEVIVPEVLTKSWQRLREWCHRHQQDLL